MLALYLVVTLGICIYFGFFIFQRFSSEKHSKLIRILGGIGAGYVSYGILAVVGVALFNSDELAQELSKQSANVEIKDTPKEVVEVETVTKEVTKNVVENITAKTVTPTPAEASQSFKRGMFHTSEGFTINNKPAKSLYFGADDGRYIDFVAAKARLNSRSFNLVGKSRDPDFNASLNWDGLYCVLSSKHDTYFNLSLFEDKKYTMSGKFFCVGSQPKFVVF